MKKFFLIAVFLWGITSVYSQEHATCDDALHITTSFYGPIIAEGWADSSLCVPNNENMYFGKSHKVVWFSFIVPYDTVLTFDIVPANQTDDFDFMLFKADKGDFCRTEAQRKVKPIRTNFAKPQKGSNGKTGLSADATEELVAPGNNSAYSSSLPVKKGEWYYLVVDNYVSTKGGFYLKVHLRFNAKTNDQSTMDAMPVKAPPMVPQYNPNFFIHVLDSANHPIKATLILDGVQKNKSIKIDTSNYSLQLGKYQTIKIRANAEGHMPYQSSYTSSGDTSSATFWIHLEPIKADKNITLKDIQFQQDSPAILSVSKPALEYVLQFLLSNPKVNILIKGYVNDPHNTWSKDYDQNLSERRANAVKNYLSAHGVSKNRMECVGYGRSQMLYPYPKDDEEEAANRRVEIEIQ
jgi:outer membrane protein OmpA-like peptidoglycan-associated protein